MLAIVTIPISYYRPICSLDVDGDAYPRYPHGIQVNSKCWYNWKTNQFEIFNHL